MRYLITPSLINSWQWYMNCPDDFEAQALSELVSALKREKTEPTEAILTGIRFEDDVHNVCVTRRAYRDDRDAFYARCVNDCAKVVDGGLWQVKVKKDATVCGQDFLLYGRIDVLKGPIVYDLKFTGRYETGKYKSNAQASFYLELADGSERMIYLVSTGNDWWTEEYSVNNVQSASQWVQEFWQWLPDDLRGLYTDNWEAL
jgi:hypothetical protein